MAFKRKFGSKRSSHPKRKRVSHARHARKSTRGGFAKKVMQVVRKAEMPKTFVYETAQNIGMGAGTAGGSYQIEFNPAQGLGDGQHLSTRCEIKKVTLQMIMTPGPYHASYNANPGALEVRTLLLSYKSKPQTAVAVADYFFDAGTAVAQVNANLFDQVMPIDKTVYDVFRDHKCKLGHSVYSFDAGAGAAVYNYDSNNDFKLNVKYNWDITKAFQKRVTFGNAGAAVGAANTTARIPSFVWMCSPADNTVGNATNAVNVTFRVVWTYTDF